MRNKKAYLIIALILALSIFTTACTQSKEPANVGEDVVAIVGGREITIEEFNTIFTVYQILYENRFGKEFWNEEIEGKKALEFVKERSLDMMVILNVALPQAEKEKVSISDEEFEILFKDWIMGIQEDGKYEAVLSERGLSEEALRDFAKQDMIFTKFLEEYVKTFKMTDKEAKEHYDNNPQRFNFEEVKASHILVKTREEALAVRERAVAGEDFEELAVELSIEPIAETSKGSLGYFARGLMVPQFEEVVFSMEINEISQPVQTTHGFHIIRFEDRRDTTLEFNEIKEYIKQDSYAVQEAIYDRLKQGKKIYTYIENIK
jgi:foldase protein PrsA